MANVFEVAPYFFGVPLSLAGGMLTAKAFAWPDTAGSAIVAGALGVGAYLAISAAAGFCIWLRHRKDYLGNSFFCSVLLIPLLLVYVIAVGTVARS